MGIFLLHPLEWIYPMLSLRMHRQLTFTLITFLLCVCGVMLMSSSSSSGLLFEDI
jgi:hypothetical protein